MELKKENSEDHISIDDQSILDEEWGSVKVEISNSPRLKTSMAAQMMMKRLEGPQLHIVIAVQAAEEGNLGREGKIT